MARMGFLDKAEELDKMIEAERTRLKKVQVSFVGFPVVALSIATHLFSTLADK